MARRAELVLADAFPEGAPSNSDRQRWLSFIALALQLAMTLDEMKVASFKAQLVRQTVSRNPLGIMLCVRSLIEHKAVAIWLVKRLGSQWTEIGKRMKPGGDLPTHAAKLEEALAKFLGGTMGSAEAVLPSTKQEMHGSRRLHLSLPDIVSGADLFRQLYDIASAALHGRIYRGLDLLPETAREGSSLDADSVLVLEWLCDRDERMDLQASAAILIMNFEHAASRGGAASVASDFEVKGAFDHFEGKLKPGRDYTGDGSREKPFRFRRHLQCHPASYKLLQQLGIEVTSQQLRRDADGQSYDVYQTDDREMVVLYSL